MIHNFFSKFACDDIKVIQNKRCKELTGTDIAGKYLLESYDLVNNRVFLQHRYLSINPIKYLG